MDAGVGADNRVQRPLDVRADVRMTISSHGLHKNDKCIARAGHEQQAAETGAHPHQEGGHSKPLMDAGAGADNRVQRPPDVRPPRRVPGTNYLLLPNYLLLLLYYSHA